MGPSELLLRRTCGFQVKAAAGALAPAIRNPPLKHAPKTPKDREIMVHALICGVSKFAAARQFNTTRETVAKRVLSIAPRGRRRWFTGPRVETSFKTTPNSA